MFEIRIRKFISGNRGILPNECRSCLKDCKKGNGKKRNKKREGVNFSLKKDRIGRIRGVYLYANRVYPRDLLIWHE